jgi:hypothetical protein
VINKMLLSSKRVFEKYVACALVGCVLRCATQCGATTKFERMRTKKVKVVYTAFLGSLKSLVPETHPTRLLQCLTFHQVTYA